MRILRFDGTGGASGDMILGSLIALGVPVEYLESELGKLPLDHFHLHAGAAASHGIQGLRLKVECHDHDHHHHESFHRHGAAWRDIRAMLETGALPGRAKALSLEVFAALAAAEAGVHGVAPEEVHFHEVGATDSIVDIVGACLGLEWLKVDAVATATLATGSGIFECAHGVYPIPAPATLELIRQFNLRVQPGPEASELLTPTAAALLGAWPQAPLPASATVAATGNAFGHRKLEHVPNWLRATLYDSAGGREAGTAELIELACNLDDCTGEVIAAAQEELFAAGALDAWTVAIGMKKSRPGITLCALAEPEKRDALLEVFFRHTTTFGVRETRLIRHQLEREVAAVATPYGEVPVKIGRYRGRTVSRHPEYEVCRELAKQTGVPVKTVIAAALAQEG